MDVNLIITIVIYSLFFLSLLVGAFWGLGRGLKKSTLRLATLVGFLIIAGIITPLISSALLTIDLSFLHIDIGGNVVTTIPNLIDTALAEIPQYEQLSALPSVMTFVEGLPIAALNIIVFMLLIFVMQFISWIAFIILSKTTLKETKLEKLIKKQKKLEKLNAKKPIDPKQKKPVPLVAPKRRRMLGALVGMVQGFILIFLVLMPITSLMGSFAEIAAVPEGVVAEEGGDGFDGDLLNETTGDLIRNALGEETFGYFQTYNNAIPTKLLNLLGFNNVIFDSLTSINVNGQGIALRRDAVHMTKIFNEIVEIKNEIDLNDSWSELNFDGARRIVNVLFDTGVVKAFAEDMMPFAIDMIEDNNTFDEMEYGNEIYNGIQTIIDEYEANETGFINGLKNDVIVLVDIAEYIFESGIFDEIMSANENYEEYISIVEEDDYELLTNITDKIFNSFMFRVLTSTGLNILLEIGTEELSNDGIEINLGTTDYDEIDWDLVKESFGDFITNGLEIFSILDTYGIIENFENPETLAEEISSSDITSIMSFLGQEIDLLKDFPLFEGQTATPFTGVVDWAAAEFPDFIDEDAILDLTSWEDELENLSSSIVMFKESGVLSYIINAEDVDFEIVIDMLMTPVNEESTANSYLIEILNPLVNFSLSKKVIVYGLNELNVMLGDMMEITMTEFDYETFPDDQNEDIVNVMESIANAFSLFSEGLLEDDEEGGEEGGDFNLSDLDLTRLSGLLTALQQNAFRIGTTFEVGVDAIDLINKTVEDGGIFANYYISLINYIVGDTSGINYKTVDWLSFFESAQSLMSVIDDLGGEEGGIDNFLDFGNPETEEDLSNIFDALGFGQDEDENGINDFVESLVDLQGVIEDLETALDETELYEEISGILDALINSENEDGGNTIDSIIEMIGNVIGDTTISEQINSTILGNEQTVTDRLYILLFNYTNSDLNPLDYLDIAPDTKYIEKTRFEATISDLTCGATFVLQQAVNSGTRIYITGIDALTLESEIDAALTANGITDIAKIAEIKGYLLTDLNHLFVLEII
ncbi:MAG: hypothetical protein PHS54_03190 [Clostridia bacterium]|nr:hypothetical protein [Clostridia bacterium]